MNSVVLDTDVASLIFKSELPDSMAAQLVGYRPCLTFVTLAGAGEVGRAEVLGSATSRPVDQVAQRHGGSAGDAAGCSEVGRDPPSLSSGVALARRMTRGSRLVYDVPLATLNVKDFADFVDHEGLELISC